MVDIDKYRDVHFVKRENCIVCGTKLAKPVIDLPDFPITEIYVSEKVSEKIAFVDQAFHFCNYCGQGQLSNVIEQELLYGNDYVTSTSTSPSAIESINVFLDFINDNLKGRLIKSIVEIGCNDLYMLNKIKRRANKLYGIDPILKGRENELKDDCIIPIGEFFEKVDLKRIDTDIDVVLSSHTLEHVNDPKGLIKNLIDNATSKTLFLFQFPGLEPLILNARFDQVHHQHLNYFSLKSVIYILEDVGAELVNFRFNPYHWGTLMISFKKKDEKSKNLHARFDRFIAQITDEQIHRQYKLFKDSMNIANRRINSYENKTIYGYGAALMLPLLNYYLKDLNRLKCVFDDDKSKNGLYYINLPLKIVFPGVDDNMKDSIILVTAINSKQSIRAITSRLINMKVRDIIIPSNLI